MRAVVKNVNNAQLFTASMERFVPGLPVTYKTIHTPKESPRARHNRIKHFKNQRYTIYMIMISSTVIIA